MHQARPHRRSIAISGPQPWSTQHASYRLAASWTLSNDGTEPSPTQAKTAGSSHSAHSISASACATGRKVSRGVRSGISTGIAPR